MSLIRTHRSLDPLESLLRLQGPFLRSFDLPGRVDTALRLRTDGADGQGYEIRLEMPGTPPDQVVVETRDRVVEISIRAGEDSRDPARSRSVRLPNDADVDRAEAQYLHGLLTVLIPKKQAAKPRQIEIRVS